MPRIMGLDVGDTMVGVAVSDEGGVLAVPKPPLRRTQLPADWEAIRELARRYQVAGIVVGLPVNMDGSLGFQARKVQDFVEGLRQHVDCPVEFWDERLTTVEAERKLAEAGSRGRKRRQRVDGAAAAILLQSFLDRRRTRERSEMMSDKDLHEPFADDDDVITLTDEEGQDHDFVVVDVIEVRSKEYAILLPYEAADDEEAEAVILRVEKSPDGDDQLVEIEDENEWQAVVDAYEAVLDADEGED